MGNAFRRIVPVVVVALASAAGSSAALAGAFQAVGAMAEPRWEPVVVTLADGSALVIGGWKKQGDDSVGIAGAERFDPATNQFTPVGAMAQPHLGHAAMRLSDGRVLVVGGVSQFATGDETAPHVVLHAELYDPAMSTFARAGKMAGIRGNPTLNQLPDGRILVAGGVGKNGSLDTVEIYDPATRTSTIVARLPRQVIGHNTILLRDGRVLLTGGTTKFEDEAEEDLVSSHLFLPATAEVVAAGTMVQPRESAGATLLGDGRVLILGGWGVDASGEFEPLAAAEVYVP